MIEVPSAALSARSSRARGQVLQHRNQRSHSVCHRGRPRERSYRTPLRTDSSIDYPLDKKCRGCGRGATTFGPGVCGEMAGDIQRTRCSSVLGSMSSAPAAVRPASEEGGSIPIDASVRSAGKRVLELETGEAILSRCLEVVLFTLRRASRVVEKGEREDRGALRLRT